MTGAPSRWDLRTTPETDFPAASRLQEDLLRAGTPAVSVSVLTDRGISYGVGVPDGAPYLRRAGEEHLPVHRRRSGGTGILHLPGDIVWGIVLPRTDPRVGRGFVGAYPRLGSGLVALLRGRGHLAEWETAPGLTPDYCPLSRRGYVLTAGGRIVGAAAQHATGRALLHHGLISASVDRETVVRVFDLSDPAWADRLTGLSDLGVSVRPGEVSAALVDALDG